MPIVRTAKGTAQDKIVAPTHTLASVAIASGASIIVLISDEGRWPHPTVTWGSTNLVEDAYHVVSTVAASYIYSAHGVTGGTQTVTVTYGGNQLSIAWAVIEVTGLASSAALDQIAVTGSSSSGVNADSGLCPTTTQADEILIGCIGVDGPNGDGVPTWLNSFSAGQRLGTTGGSATSNQTVNEGYRIVSATGQYKAAATLGTSRNWAALLATYKGAAVAVAAKAPPVGAQVI